MKKLIIIISLIPILAWPQIKIRPIGLVEAVQLMSPKFTPELFCQMVKALCKNADYVIAQACHETGWFKSYNCQSRNNYFGMKLTSNGIAIKADSATGYSIYKTWFDSVKDYAIWQSRYYTGQNYCQFLGKDRVYAEDVDYIAKVLALMQSDKFKKLYHEN
jgi:uncharacterized FlgJ-related protein